MRTPGAGTRRSWLSAGSLLAFAITLTSTSFAQATPGMAAGRTSVPMGWSAPVTVDTSPPFAAPNPLSAIACPKANWCLAGDLGGDLLFSSDPGGGSAAWHQTASGFRNEHQDLTGLARLVCPSTSFCLAAVGVNEGPPYAIFTSTNPTGNHSAWHRVRRSLSGDISCPSAQLCMFNSGHGLVYSTDPGSASSTWKSITLSQVTDMTGVSCASRSFCLATDNAGDLFTSANPAAGHPTWKAAFVDHTAELVNPSCPSASLCYALDSHGSLFFSTDPARGASSWQATTAPANLRSLVCLSASFCYARDNSGGDVLTTSDPTGGSSAWHVTDLSDTALISAISCASAEACVAVTGDAPGAGSVFVTTDPGGGPTAWHSAEIDGENLIASLDCPSLRLCVAGDDAGNLLIATNPAGGAGAWHRVHLSEPVGDITAIGCAGTAFCVAADNQGDIVWSADPRGGASAWQVADVDGSAWITSVACPSESLCVAGDTSGDIVSSADPASGGSSWHVASLGSSPGALYVSCASSTFCVSTGTTSVFTSTSPAGGGGAWTLTASIPAAAGIGPVSCPTTSLCVALGGFNFSVNDGPSPVVYSTSQPTGNAADWHIVGQGGESFFGRPVRALSCPSASLCLSEDTGVVFDTTNPAGTSVTTWQPAGVSAVAVSCPTSTRCVAVSGFSNIQIGTVLTPTSTVVTSAPKSALVGHKITVKFRVRSAGTGKGTAAPTGPVTVSYSDNVKCTAKLSPSKGFSSGECSFTVSRPGNHVLTASYASHGKFAASSASRRLVVRRRRASS
ncbi:MAG TPA: hypothetical protein VFI65_04085 [Streptosporangiaceae bacterium]|nr:hypothetical protein [Streptosporangiaceae bacterium]